MLLIRILAAEAIAVFVPGQRSHSGAAFGVHTSSSAGERASAPLDNKSTLATMLLRSLITDPAEDGAGEGGLPKMFGAGMAATAKAQLRQIFDCESAQAILVKAFFESALVAEAQLGVVQVPSAPKALLSA